MPNLSERFFAYLEIAMDYPRVVNVLEAGQHLNVKHEVISKLKLRVSTREQASGHVCVCPANALAVSDHTNTFVYHSNLQVEQKCVWYNPQLKFYVDSQEHASYVTCKCLCTSSHVVSVQNVRHTTLAPRVCCA